MWLLRKRLYTREIPPPVLISSNRAFYSRVANFFKENVERAFMNIATSSGVLE